MVSGAYEQLMLWCFSTEPWPSVPKIFIKKEKNTSISHSALELVADVAD